MTASLVKNSGAGRGGEAATEAAIEAGIEAGTEAAIKAATEAVCLANHHSPITVSGSDSSTKIHPLFLSAGRD